MIKIFMEFPDPCGDLPFRMEPDFIVRAELGKGWSSIRPLVCGARDDFGRSIDLAQTPYASGSYSYSYSYSYFQARVGVGVGVGN